MPGQDPSKESNHRIAAVIREELARKRLSRAALAAQARISLSSLEKALSGQRPFTTQSLIRIEEALGRPVRSLSGTASQLAPAELGSYARPAVVWLEGEYLTLLPSLSDRAGVYAYRTQIIWDEVVSHLVFRESDRLDSAFTQQGAVSIPHQSGHIYLVTNKHGQYRLAVLSRPTISGEIYGLLTTLQSGRGAQLTPVSMPIALIPTKNFDDPVSVGKIDALSAARNLPRQVEQNLGQSFAVLVRP
jgi:transcriptional regulator with XRE-family HTH domain